MTKCCRSCRADTPVRHAAQPRDVQRKWERSDSNREPRDYESPALTVELRSPQMPDRSLVFPRLVKQHSHEKNRSIVRVRQRLTLAFEPPVADADQSRSHERNRDRSEHDKAPELHRLIVI